MDSEQPFEELRKAWRAHQAPLPSEPLETCDAQTQAAVETLRSAWAQSPAAIGPTRDVPRCRAALVHSGVLKRRPRIRPWLLVLEAVAALWIAYALTTYWTAPQSLELHVSQSTETNPVAPSGEKNSHAGAVHPLAGEPQSTDLEVRPSAEHLADVTPVSLRPDGFEMRSGRVRLVLLDTTVQSSTQP
jgi:hypothetical protein